MGVVGDSRFDIVSISTLYMSEPSCRPMFAPPCLGPPLVPLKLYYLLLLLLLVVVVVVIRIVVSILVVVIACGHGCHLAPYTRCP